jgi:hypothetical protein
MEYEVSWIIEVDAESPLEAALAAEGAQLAQITGEAGAVRGFFEVRNKLTNTLTCVDLSTRGNA